MEDSNYLFGYSKIYASENRFFLWSVSYILLPLLTPSTVLNIFLLYFSIFYVSFVWRKDWFMVQEKIKQNIHWFSFYIGLIYLFVIKNYSVGVGDVPTNYRSIKIELICSLYVICAQYGKQVNYYIYKSVKRHGKGYHLNKYFFIDLNELIHP